MRRKYLVFSLIILLFIPVVYADPGSHHIDGVPLLDQGDKPWCGVCSVVMILQYWDIEVNVDDAGEEIDPELDGVYTYELKEYLDDFEVGIYELDSMEMLKKYILMDHPVIVLQWVNQSMKSGHYRVVVGYDSENVYVHDPNGFKADFTYEEFFLLWERNNEYGLTISPKRQFITEPMNRTIQLGVTALEGV